MPTHHFLTSWVQFESLFERLSQIFENIAVKVMLRLKVIGKVDSIRRRSDHTNVLSPP